MLSSVRRTGQAISRNVRGFRRAVTGKGSGESNSNKSAGARAGKAVRRAIRSITGRGGRGRRR